MYYGNKKNKNRRSVVFDFSKIKTRRIRKFSLQNNNRPKLSLGKTYTKKIGGVQITLTSTGKIKIK